MNRPEILIDIPARSGAPIVCDLTDATDTAEERLAAYGRLFATALVDRRRELHAAVWVFDARHEVVDQLGELMRREAACCPFADYRLVRRGDLVEFTMASADPAVTDILDLAYDLPTHHDAPPGQTSNAIDRRRSSGRSPSRARAPDR